MDSDLSSIYCRLAVLGRRQCPTGPTGPIGATGTAGPTGSTGPLGPTGPLGLAYGSFLDDFTTALTAEIPNTGSSSDIHVTSTSGMPDSGAVLIDKEIIRYTGKTATTFTGITRGMASSQSSSHAIGSAVTSAQVTSPDVPSIVYVGYSGLANGVYLDTVTSTISVATDGMYNIQFSIYAINYSNEYDNFAVWFVKDGVDIPSSASHSTVVNSHSNQPGATIMTVNFFVAMTPANGIQLYWTSTKGKCAIVTGPPRVAVPTTPSTILTVNQIA